MTFNIPPIESVSPEEYWAKQSIQPPLECMKNPCGDCAMVTGFYKDMADALLEQPKEIQEKVTKSWFCHNVPNRACAGIRDYIENKK